MPLYEYQCDACAHRFEVIQKFSDPLVEVCPKCGGAVTKLLSSPAIQFKGSGWYITDYAKKSGGAAGGAKGESAPASGEAKGDQKTSSESSSAAPSTPAPAASSTKTP
jgi:putative FmdB family regulatory protein